MLRMTYCTRDEERSGRPSSISDELLQQVENKVRNDRRVTLKTLSENVPHISLMFLFRVT